MRRSYVIAAAIAILAGGWLATGQFPNSGEAPAAPTQSTVGSQSVGESAPEGSADGLLVPAEPEIRVQVMGSIATEQQRSIVLRGRTDADRVVEVRAQTDGAVIEIPAEKGNFVREGDVLAILDGADRASRLAEARALLLQRETETAAAQKLSDQGFAPKLNLADLAAKVALARAAVAAMEVEVGYLRVLAPIDGTLDERPAEIGRFLQRGDQVATIVDLDPILIVGNATERDVGFLSLGAPAKIRLLDGREFPGTIRFIAARADESTRTFRIEVAVANPDFQILDGLSAELDLPIGRIKAHRVSPAILTLGDRGELGVMLVDATNHALFAPVTIVREDETGIWLAGLPDQVSLIVVGQDFVIPGQPVVPIQMDAPVPEASSP